ncbi:MAG: hypothetical protein WBC05_13885 [Sedimentisphaerales bacterium]
MNDNAIYAQYDHFKDVGWQWLTDSPCSCSTGVVEVLALRHRFAQDVLVVSHHSRQGPER